MRLSNYVKLPATEVEGQLVKGWENIGNTLNLSLTTNRVLAIDTYVGTIEEEIFSAVSKLPHDVIINTKELFKTESEIIKMTDRFITDDVIFGYITNLNMSDYFDNQKLAKAKEQISNCSGKCIIVGSGAALVAPENSTLVYVDMARWEIQMRFRRHEVSALGIDNRNEPISSQYKRGYFNDWRLCDRYKDSLYHKVSYWIDTHIQNSPKMIDRQTFLNGIDKTAQAPLRVVPFFDPAPWGGQWMKDVCDLDRSKSNYGWCFDCVPEENSLLFSVNGDLFEMPSINLVLLKSRELLGEPVEARFGKEFPIRFDFLDTIKGGSLSLQVHPTTQFIRENFGMQYTQDESYYMLEADPGATVYLGLKNGIDQDAMIDDLRKAQRGEIVFDAEKYINKLPAKKHDHFLIPGGTVHCSGPEGMVLEISSTPNLFTFKMWDWQRLGLDGQPRPINVERANKVIDWGRDTDYVNKHLANNFSIVGQGEGWIEEKTGLHPNEFIETRRHRFTSAVTHNTNNSVNVLNLVEGEQAVISSPNDSFAPFTVHYAETFIIPASLGDYIITPSDPSKECVTIKAYVRI